MEKGGCKVELEFLYVTIVLAGAGLLLLLVIVQGVILMICTCYACQHGRLKKSYTFNEDTQDGLLLCTPYC